MFLKIILLLYSIQLSQCSADFPGPELTFYPKPLKYDLWLVLPTQSTLIYYIGAEHLGYKNWTAALDEFIEGYRTNILSGVKQTCSYNSLPFNGIACNVDVRSFGPCIVENLYGYHKNTPCIFITLKEMFGWEPQFYNDTELLPKSMPKSLKNHINVIGQRNKNMLNTIWVSCDGEYPADKENIGPIKYYPYQGFPGYFFPYNGQDDYLSPLVAVHLEKPTRHILINIECKAWAQNIHHDEIYNIGYVHFELLID
uniref:CSON011892 protein n=1 Tax=Culicoides sonorensis TaxID=179676 RepID=A0A336M884_CULSO